MKKRMGQQLALAALVILTGCGAAQPASVQFYAMDTVMDLAAYGKGGEAAAVQAQKEIADLEGLLSRTDPNSQVSQLNGGGGAAVPVSPVLSRLLLAATDACIKTGGAFDVTVAPVVAAWGFTADAYQVPTQAQLDALLPLVDSTRITVSGAPGAETDGADYTAALGAGQSVDLGGIAKGYASDQVEQIYRAGGVTSGKAALGGNIFVLGTKPDGAAWRIAVQDPNDAGSWVGVLSLSDAYAVTSGGYQRYFDQNGKRYHHIIDPATGYPAESGLVSVTVVAPANGARDAERPGNGTLCDAYSTALFVMGEKRALDFWRTGGDGFQLVLVTEDDRVLITAGLADQFEENEDVGYAYEIIR